MRRRYLQAKRLIAQIERKQRGRWQHRPHSRQVRRRRMLYASMMHFRMLHVVHCMTLVSSTSHRCIVALSPLQVDDVTVFVACGMLHVACRSIFTLRVAGFALHAVRCPLSIGTWRTVGRHVCSVDRFGIGRPEQRARRQ